MNSRFICFPHSGSPIREIATVTKKKGPCLIFRDGNERYAALKLSVRGRDMGSTIAEAQEKVDKAVKLKRGYSMVWQGDFENQRRAQNRLAQVVPISLLLIFLLLFIMFGNLKDAGLVFLNVPFAIVGGIAALFITGTAIGLFPAAVSSGIGSESSRPLARVVIGGILCAMLFSLLVFPLIFGWAYRNIDKKDGL